MMDFTKIATEFQGMGVMLKEQLEQTRKNILTAEFAQEKKDMLLSQIKHIENAVANPEKGLHELLKSIQTLNDSINK